MTRRGRLQQEVSEEARTVETLAVMYMCAHLLLPWADRAGGALAARGGVRSAFRQPGWRRWAGRLGGPEPQSRGQRRLL